MYHTGPGACPALSRDVSGRSNWIPNTCSCLISVRHMIRTAANWNELNASRV